VLEVFGLEGVKRLSDPSDVRSSTLEHYVLEFCRFGEVECGRPGQG